MKIQRVPLLRLLPVLAFALPVHAQTVEPTRAPSIGPYGTLGLSNVSSSAPVGPGIVNLNLRATLYHQSETVPGVLSGTQVFTVTGGAALGVTSYLDLFAAMNGYNFNEPSSTRTGPGSLVIGLKGTLPADDGSRLRIGAEAAGIFGTGDKAFNTNRVDGYDYLETRSSGSNDLLVRATQSLLFTNESRGGVGFNLHFNEGVISSTEEGRGVLLVTGAGIEAIPFNSMALGLELSSRTYLQDPNFSDPFWISPSATWRTAKFININLGADVSLSRDRGAAEPRALEPWRIFGGVSGSIDMRKGKKAAAAAKAREDREAAARAHRDSVENVLLHRNANRADVTADSLARVNAAAAAAAKALQKGSADSIAALTNKSRQDSLALAESARRLAEEKAKRSEAEKQLLSTGLLLMDAVYFETGKADISINSKPYLNIIAKMLVKYPKLEIQVAGHTDNVGGAAYNMNLSQSRAQAVRDYMVTTAPELSSYLSAKGYGLTLPKASNATATGRTLNRRTELQVLNKDVLREYNP